MKKYILIAAMSAGLFSACNQLSSVAESPKLQVPQEDFTSVLVALDYSQNQYAITLAKRTINDSVDKEMASIVRDTSYEIPIMDTMRDYLDRPMIDHKGKATMQTNWVKIDKNMLVVDFNKVVPTVPAKE